MRQFDVVLCTYNGAQYLEQQLDSIANQSLPPRRILIQDDNSTDCTWDIIERFREMGAICIQTFRNSERLGYTKNFESLLLKTTADYILLSDQDDVWHPKKAETIVRVLERETHADMVFSDAYVISSTGEKISDSLWRSIGFNPSNSLPYSTQLLRRMLRYNVATGTTFGLKRRILEYSIPFYDFYPHDAWLALASSLQFKCFYIDKKLTYYRLHHNNTIGVERLKVEKASRARSKGFENSFYLRMRLYRKLLVDYKCGDAVKADIKDALEFSELRDSCYIEKGARVRALFFLFVALFSLKYKVYANGWRSFAKDLFYLLGGRNT